MTSDDKFIETVIAGQTECLVSGDNHLLALKTFHYIPIIPANMFLDWLGLV
jgi:uncharacterized protein